MNQTSQLTDIAGHFDVRAPRYGEKYRDRAPRHLFEHEKRQRAEITRQWVREIAQRRGSGRLLDVGCGDGRGLCTTLAELTSWYGTGVDVSGGMIDRAGTLARQTGVAARAAWRKGTVEEVNESFDVVTALGVVGYQSDQLGFLASLADRVTASGLLIFTFASAWSIPKQLRCLAQTARRAMRGGTQVRFRALTVRSVDKCLIEKGLRRIDLRWLCFGLGLSHSRMEIELSRWFEERCGPITTAQFLAQVGLACYQAGTEADQR